MSRVALQLYTVRDLCAEDLAAVLERTAELGFEGVELHDLHGHEADTVRALLDENGLVACGRHAGLPSIEGELESLRQELVTLGTDRLVVAWVEPPASAAEASITCERIVRAAECVSECGLKLGFHNHDGELVALDDGSTLLDRLVDVPEESLFLELDLGWIWHAGVEPLSLLERLGPRAPLVHLKDLRRDEGVTTHVPVGSGDVGWEGLSGALARAGTQWAIVEQDEVGEQPAFAAVETSLREVRRLLGATT